MSTTLAYVTITLTYADSTTFITSFPTMAEAEAWVANEQLKPYWQSTTLVEYDSVMQTTPW